MPTAISTLSLTDLVLGFIGHTRIMYPDATFPICYSRVWDSFFLLVRDRLASEFEGVKEAIGEFKEDVVDPPHNEELRRLLKLLSELGILAEDEFGRTYPTANFETNLALPLFSEMLTLAQECEGLLRNIEPIDP